MRRARTALMALVLLTTGAFFIHFNLTRPRLLILHSDVAGFYWVQEVNRGIARVLRTRTNYVVRWYYMDIQRHPDSGIEAGTVARRLIEQWRPDVILAVADEAQEFVTRHYVNQSGVQIVFADVHDDISRYGFNGASNVTGIFQRQPLQAIKDALLAAAKGSTAPVRIMNIGDTSEAVQDDCKFIDAFDWSPLEFAGSRSARTFEDWQQAIRQAQHQADFILVTDYRTLSRSRTDPTPVPALEVVKWTEANSRVPVVGTYESYAADGGSLAIGSSPYEQGEIAARMAIEILDTGRPAARIPAALPRQPMVSMRGSGLKARALQLPPIYEAFARATNHYYE